MSEFQNGNMQTNAQQPEQPPYQQPVSPQQPMYGQPSAPQQPMYGQPPVPQQPIYQQPVYQQPMMYQQPFYAPVGQLRTDRGLLKYILLSLITCGIYGLVAMSGVSNDINIIASRYDGRRTMHFCLLTFIVAPITFGIGAIVWFHKISARIGNELRRRNIAYSFDAGSFWLWYVLGSLIVVGPFVYLHNMFKAMNLLSQSYNVNG